MTMTPPPPTPPVVVVPAPSITEAPTVVTQEQNQQQQQDQNNTTNLGTLNQDQNTKSDADSSADSTSTQSSTLSNIQVNQSSNRLDYGSFKIPETVLTVTGTVNSNGSDAPSYSGIVGLNVPLGGGMRKDVKKALSIQVAADQLAFERTYASVCANLDSDSYSVTNRAATLTMLKSCRTEIVKRNTPKPLPVPDITPPVVVTPPVVNSEIEQLRKDNAELRLLIGQLVERLDKSNTVPGGY